MTNVFQFLDVQRNDPYKRTAQDRIREFAEIYHSYDLKQAAQQADRCPECGNPYCEWKCPVHNFIPNWLKLVAEGNMDEAVEMAHKTNTQDDGVRVIAAEKSEYSFQTRNLKIFPGGDMVRGSDLVVTAIHEGRVAAEVILDYLEI